MAYGTKYQWTIAGRTRTWTVSLQLEGYASSVTALMGARTARIVWGDTTNDLDSRILPVDMRLQVLDPDQVLFNELSAAGVEEDDYRLVVTDSEGEYTLNLRVRMETVRTGLFTNMRVPMTEMYAYCGLSNMSTIDAVTLSSYTFHDTFRYLLVSNAQAQNIDYVTGFYPENVHSSGPVLDLVRFNRMDLYFQQDGRKGDQASEQLQGLLEALDARVWNGFDGRWHVKHVWSLGEYVTGRAPQRYTHASTALTALSTLQMGTLTVSAATMDREATRRLEPNLQAIEIEQGPANDNRFHSVVISHFSDFEEGWVSSTDHYAWTGTPSKLERSTSTYAGSYSFKILNQGAAQQDIIHIAGGSPLRLFVTCRHAHELTASGTGSGTETSQLLVKWIPYDSGESTYYATASGWTTSSSYYSLVDVAVSHGAGLSWELFETTIGVESTADGNRFFNLPPYDGRLQVEIVGDAGTNFDTYIDNLEVRLLGESGNVEQQFRSVFTRFTDGGSPLTKGTIVKQSRRWFPGTIWLDEDDNGTRDTSAIILQADTDGAGAWEEAAGWVSEAVDDDALYADLAELSAESRIAQQQDPLEVIEADILGIVPPEQAVRYSGANYVPLYCDFDLATERTKVVMVKKQRVLSTDAPFAEAGTLFVTTQASSSTPSMTGNSLMRVNTDGSTDTLYTFIGPEPDQITGDTTSRKLYVTQGQKIWCCNYDGSNMTQIYEHSGNDVTGLSYQSAGTYAGYLYYTSNSATSEQDRLHRVDTDGNNQANVGNVFTSGGPRCIVTSGTVVLINTSYSNASIISMPAVTGSYSVVHTTQTANNAVGIAADVSGDRIWVQANGTLKETNFAGTAYTDRTAINNGTSVWWDVTGARLWIASNSGIRYRAGAAINTDVPYAPLTSGDGGTGSYGTNDIWVVQ